MNLNLHINPEIFNFGIYNFYFFSIIAVVIMMLVEGNKRKYPFVSWSLVVVSAVIWGIIGGKLVGLNFHDWKLFFTNFHIPVTENKSVLGYLLFGLIAVVLVRKYLNFKNQVAGTVLVAWPVALIIARIGCLFSGCCYGTVTETGFGVIYTPNSLAFAEHVHNGFISQTNAFALPVHPTQIYEIVFLLLLIPVTLYIQKRKLLKSELSLLLVSFTTYGIFRFFEEFVRAGGYFVGYFKGMQLAVALAVFVLIYLIYNNEKRFVPQIIAKPMSIPGRNLKIALLNALIILVGINFYSPLELVVLKSLLALIILGLLIETLKQSIKTSVVRIPVMLVSSAILFMSQTTEVPLNPIDSTSRFFTVSGGAAKGSYKEFCGSTFDYQAVGIDAKFTKVVNPKLSFSAGANYTYRMYEIENSKHAFVAGIRPYGSLNAKYIGIIAGVQFVFDNTFKFSEPGFVENPMIIPSLYGRLGNLNSFFADIGVYNQLASDLPVFNMGLGYGFKQFPGSMIRAGLSESGFYVNPKFALNKSVTIDPILFYGDENSYQMSLRLHINLFLPDKIKK